MASFVDLFFFVRAREILHTRHEDSFTAGQRAEQREKEEHIKWRTTTQRWKR